MHTIKKVAAYAQEKYLIQIVSEINIFKYLK